MSARETTLLVSGATGLIGGRLLASLPATGPRIRALTRDPGRAPAALAARAELVGWDGLRVVTGETEELDLAEIVREGHMSLVTQDLAL